MNEYRNMSIPSRARHMVSARHCAPAPFPVHRPLLRVALVLGALATAGCTPLEDTVYFADQDFTPPSVVGLEVTGPRKIVARFSEVTSAEQAYVSAELGDVEVSADGRSLVFETRHAGAPGRAYQIEAVVSDEAGNTVSFIETVYGYNPNLPEVLINEVTTQGSGNHPDMVELRLLSEGNLAGLTLYAGAPGEHDGRMVFPAAQLPADSYVVVHFKPEGLPEEVDETTDPTTSGGLDATDSGWDFWVPDGSGLSGNNGAVSLYDQPGGRLLDAIVYSNRTSDSDERYRGFGSKSALAMVDRVAADDGWLPEAAPEAEASAARNGVQLRPEDAVDPEDSTATRSISRGSDAADTDTAADWHITPTSGYTFGGPNTDEVYVP